MNLYVQRLRSSWIAVALVLAFAFEARSQGTPTSSIAGTVFDTSGGGVPGCAVTVTSDATNATFETVTDDRGAFNVPALNPGTYTVTIALTGFKQVVLRDVRLNAATPATVRATLELGNLAETIQVEAGAEIVQTQSSSVATTVDANQIINLPMTSRNAIDFIPFLPGVTTPGTTRDSMVNGLPQGAINITVDGMNVQDNFLKTSDGFFARMSPRLDAIEEVTVTTAGQTADSAGQGAIQIRFVTRSGTNTLSGSGYYYYRNDALNSNTWFNNRANLAKGDLLQHQPGVRIGGPIVIPGLFNGRNRAFFFVNYEELRQPNSVARNRTIMSPSAQEGRFRYRTSGGIQEVDLLALAGRNGLASTPDPTVAKLLADIRAATNTGGAVSDLTDPNTLRYRVVNEGESKNRYPTVRVDVNLTQNHRLTGSYNYNKVFADPDTTNSRDPMFPGFPATGPTDSDRYTTAYGVRSTLGANLVNELRFGATGGASKFVPNYTPALFGGSGAGSQGGFVLAISEFAGISNASGNANPSSREASTKVIENNLNWQRGAHTITTGFSWTQVDLWLQNQNVVPTLNFGLVDGDPAVGVINAANLPNASGTDITNARNLYAVLTGRVRQIQGDARINEGTGEYTYLGQSMARGRMREVGLYVQDAWRMRPNFTLNYGVRYELQFPFYPLNDSYSTSTVADVWGVSGVGNLFRPGVLEGQTPTFQQFRKGQRAYNVDWNNIAPNLGFNWVPQTGNGVVRAILGEGPSIRGGYSLAYNRNGMSDFSDVFGNNPGVTITTNRNQALGNLGGVPLLLRESDRLGPPSFPSTPVYPMRDVVTGDVNIFDPNLQVPYATSWNIGVERAIGRHFSLDVRYVGTRHLQGWTTYNYNEPNFVDNGFMGEFGLAQANLRANIAAGRGANFRYAGPGTGTSPLPIMLAYFAGVGAGQAGNPSSYSAQQFQDALFVNALALSNVCCSSTANSNPNPSFVFSMYNNAAFNANAARAGLPVNFFLANPDLRGGANITGNGGYTSYNGLQIAFNRRYSQGLLLQGSYVFGRADESRRYSFRTPRVSTRNAGTDPGDVSQAFKLNGVWELPLGRDRRFLGSANGFVDRLVGGWSIGATARIQSGRLLDLGNVNLVGMDVDEFRGEFRLRFEDDGKVYMLPKDIRENTVRAFSTSATATGYGPLGPPSGRYVAPANTASCLETAPGFGDCGLRTLIVQGPLYHTYDLAVVKRVPLFGRTRLEFRAEALNVFNITNFAPVTGISTFGDTAFQNNVDNFEVTGVADSGRTIQLVGRFSW